MESLSFIVNDNTGKILYVGTNANVAVGFGKGTVVAIMKGEEHIGALRCYGDDAYQFVSNATIVKEQIDRAEYELRKLKEEYKEAKREEVHLHDVLSDIMDSLDGGAKMRSTLEDLKKTLAKGRTCGECAETSPQIDWDIHLADIKSISSLFADVTEVCPKCGYMYRGGNK